MSQNPPAFAPVYSAGDKSNPSAPFLTTVNPALARFAAKHELYQETLDDLVTISRSEMQIAVLADDSTSMATRDSFIDGSREIRSRWDELKETTQNVISLALCLNPLTVDLWFLNSKPEMNVTSEEQVKEIFNLRSPNGYTPLSATLRKIYSHYPSGNLLILIATDGEPSDGRNSKTSIQMFKAALMDRDYKRVGICILACTNEEDSISYLNGWDKEIKRLDCCDDFSSEKKELKKFGHKLDRGVYATKCLLGGWMARYDLLDECADGDVQMNSSTVSEKSQRKTPQKTRQDDFACCCAVM